MSYMRTHHPVRARGRQPARRSRGLGGIWEELSKTLNTSESQACVDKANASSQVASIDSQIDTLSKTWKPTGYYRPTDIQQLLATLADQAAAAGAALAAAPRSTSDAADQIAQAFDDLKRRYQQRAFVYQDAIAKAKASGANVIDGANVKDWVIDSMRAISDAYVVATVMQCMQSWVEALLDRAYQAIAAIGAVAYRIVGIAIKAGDKIIDAADTIVNLMPIIKWGAIGVGALFVASKVRAFRRGR